MNNISDIFDWKQQFFLLLHHAGIPHNMLSERQLQYLYARGFSADAAYSTAADLQAGIAWDMALAMNEEGSDGPDL